jgi:Ulp1 family protease
VDIFSKRFLLVPINESLHWSLVVVVNPYKFILDSLPGVIDAEYSVSSPTFCDEPCLIMMDSLSCHDSKQIGIVINSFLTFHWKHKRNDANEVKFSLPVYCCHFCTLCH